MLYGHLFYRVSIPTKVEYLNKNLNSGKYDCLEDLANDMFLNANDIVMELANTGFYYVAHLKQFVQTK